MGVGLGGVGVVELLLDFVGVVTVAGHAGRGVYLGVLPRTLRENLGLTIAGHAALMAAPQLLSVEGGNRL